MRIGLVVSQFNSTVTKKMEDFASRRLSSTEISSFEIVRVPGAFDIPFAVKAILPRVDAVVTLGAVIQGGTHHDVIIMQAVAKKLLDLSAESGKPVSLGISGPRQTPKQARERAEEYAVRAVDAAIALAGIMKTRQ